MVSHIGSTRFALFLLCCLGTLMLSHTGPIYQLQPKEIQAIIVELQNLSKKLLDDYVSALETSILSCFFKTDLPSCFTSDSQAPGNINSSAILPYFKAISPSLNNDKSLYIIEQLDKLNFQNAPETEVSMPTDNFERKRFILTILRWFSNCLEHRAQ
uniref:Interleukin-31 n=1 Tax=Equus asinus asinus TaxID=83772 RepID=A0A8C4M0D0_EQUAS